MTSFSAKSFYLLAAITSFGLSAVQGQTLFAPNGTVSASENGNVGIGTAFPDQKLTIQAGHGDTQFRLFSDAYGQGINGVNTALLSLWASEPGWTWGGVGIGNNVTNSGGIVRVSNTRGGSYIRLLDNTMYLSVVDSTGTDRNGITINSIGNIGVGTTNPTAKLNVAGGSLVAEQLIYVRHIEGKNWNDPSTVGDLYLQYNNSNNDVILNNGKMVLRGSTGNVGIGTTNPTHKLAVNGTIKAKEVIVETTGWSDYVFADGYALAPLAEVEAHIKEHKHLPGIPSAAQVADHGISVGDMQAKLLAKIEELTLHVIAQEKRGDTQAREIAELKAQNALLLQASGREPSSARKDPSYP